MPLLRSFLSWCFLAAINMSPFQGCVQKRIQHSPTPLALFVAVATQNTGHKEHREAQRTHHAAKAFLFYVL